jgi:small subunit ribosomal protein S4
MARYTGPVCKLCRREGEKLFLKGDRCMSPKCPFERERGFPPGMHGRMAQFRSRQRPSDYLRQLREKQKARRIYGVQERQFRRMFDEALRRPGRTGETLLSLLECRLDNVVYRLGFAASRAQARQLVQHGHFLVNGRRTRCPSLILRPQDQITVREGSRRHVYFRDFVKDLGERGVPGWLSLDPKAMTARMLAVPSREEIETPLNEQLIVEYYSR